MTGAAHTLPYARASQGGAAQATRAFPPALSVFASLFFAWGFVTAIVDPLIPAVRAAFRLSYSQALLTQFFFFAAYGLVSVPAGAVLARAGYLRATVLALATMALGCLIVWAGARHASYDVILAGLFVIACGTTLLQVAANPLVTLVGALGAAAARLNLAQAANSLGTVLGPLVGASLLLSGGAVAGQTAGRAATLSAIGAQFAWIGAAFVALAACVALAHRAFRAPQAIAAPTGSGAALASTAARFGAVAIFFDVGAEVAVSSILIDFLRHVLSLPAEPAGRLLALYWGGLLAGRLAFGALATRIAPARLLAWAATGGAVLAMVAASAGGWIAAGAALAIGLMHAMFFPTIFSLTLLRSSAPAPAVSGLLCSAILGGAIVPQAFGQIADRFGLHAGFYVLLLGYGVIVAFARARPDRSLGGSPNAADR